VLVDVERRFVRVCFAKEPREDDLTALGGMRDRWLVYRHMVRARLRGMIANALSRTVAALGEEAWASWFDRWLDEAPPRTRYIREIVPELLDFSLPRWERDASIPPWLIELARLESARWEIGYTDERAPTAGELAFDKVPVLSAAVQVLRFAHPVHEKRDAYPEQPTQLCVYRRADDKTAVWAIDSFTAGILESFAAGDRTITDTVKSVAARLEIPLDEKLVQRIGTVLAELVQRGILLGAR
jgi:hypothetical protein